MIKPIEPISVLVALTLLLPGVVQAGEIDVSTNNVKVKTDRNGSMYLRSGHTQISLPPLSSSLGWNSYRNLRNRPHQNCVISRQETRQTSNSNRSWIWSSTSTHRCR